ncbi:MAG: Ldh family oxidoreductase, partial [Victivallales bacterium]|nr:Ldh family oxidoreductase [Victivallales bacterium]
GIESHGTARLRSFYAKRLQAGGISPTPQVKTVSETPVTAVMDGGGGLGHPTAFRAMRLAIRKAVSNGAGFVTVHNSNHFGIAGYYAMMALEEGCIGLVMTNSNPWVVPTFGRNAMLGTNPLAVAAPSGREYPFVLDMATSTVAVGKLEACERLGKAIPLQWGTDANGIPTSSPAMVLENGKAGLGGGLLPLGGAMEMAGGYKGYGLAVLVDIFCALLAGGKYADQIAGHQSGGETKPGNISHFFGAWRVDAFRPLSAFQADLDDLLQRLKSSPKAEGQGRIYVAGEKEFEETERRLRNGIPLPDAVLSDLQRLGTEFGVAFPSRLN